MMEIAKTILSITKSKSTIKHVVPRKGDLFALEADVSKIKKMLNWEPKYTLKEGLTNTITWYKKFINN